MNAEKTELKVVQISTGSVVSPSHVDTFTPYMEVTPSRTFYIGKRLTKAGVPPMNASRFNWVDEVRWDKDGDPRGHVAVFDAEREEKAAALRRTIQDMKDALEREKLRLHELYAGPRPSTRAEDLRRAWKEQ
jgi:hypothetical protein